MAWCRQRQPAVFGSLLILVTILPYLNTFEVPWYFDDVGNIVENPLVHNFSGTARDFFLSRGIALYSFSLNYRWGGLDPAGYHVVNLAVHVLCVLLVWRLLARLLGQESLLSLAGAALFAVHPLQTQAVTYVVQRMTSLSGLFFFAAVYFYVKARTASGQEGIAVAWRRVSYLLALFCGGLAVAVKQNAAILPLVLLLVEHYFVVQSGPRRFPARWLPVLPFLFAPLLVALHDVVLPLSAGAELWKIANPTSYRQISGFEYLVTEFSVVWIYIRLLFAPVGQVFDYAYPVVDKILTWKNVLAFSGHACLLAGAALTRRRLPLISFGILWFYTTLAVESTFIPLDPYNEHRLYVPLFGFVLIMTALLRRLASRKAQVWLASGVLALFMVLTVQRNALWAAPAAFFEDNLKKSPKNARVMVMLGNAYAKQGRAGEAQQLYERAMQVDPTFDVAYTAMGKLFIESQDYDQALSVLLKGTDYNPDSVRLNELLGIAYGQKGDYLLALRHFNRVLMLKPDKANIHFNVGMIYFWRGEDQEAAGYFGQALKLDPDNDNALFYYASALFALGEKARALDALRAAVKVNPGNANALYGQISLALELGFRQEAGDAISALRRLGDPRVQEFDGRLP